MFWWKKTLNKVQLLKIQFLQWWILLNSPSNLPLISHQSWHSGKKYNHLLILLGWGKFQGTMLKQKHLISELKFSLNHKKPAQDKEAPLPSYQQVSSPSDTSMNTYGHLRVLWYGISRWKNTVPKYARQSVSSRLSEVVGLHWFLLSDLRHWFE